MEPATKIEKLHPHNKFTFSTFASIFIWAEYLHNVHFTVAIGIIIIIIDKQSNQINNPMKIQQQRIVFILSDIQSIRLKSVSRKLRNNKIYFAPKLHLQIDSASGKININFLQKLNYLISVFHNTIHYYFLFFLIFNIFI